VKKPILIIITAVLVASICANIYLVYQDISTPQTAQTRGTGYRTYSRTINRIYEANLNNTFAPPVSMQDALRTAFNRTGWTDEKIEEFNTTKVDVRIVYGYVDPATNTTIIVDALRIPTTDYSNFNVDGMTYRYMWQIVAYDAAADLMPQSHDGYCLVDVLTGEFMPLPPS
jgi:hypothetical protein